MFERAAINGKDIVERKAGLHGGCEFFEERGMKHSGVVGGEGDGNTLAEEFGERVMRDSAMSGIQLNIQSVGAEVAGQTNFERDFSSDQSVHERGTANGGDTVADAFGVEDVDGIFDLFRPTGFSSVSYEVQAIFCRVRVGCPEILERLGEFVAA